MGQDNAVLLSAPPPPGPIFFFFDRWKWGMMIQLGKTYMASTLEKLQTCTCVWFQFALRVIPAKVTWRSEDDAAISQFFIQIDSRSSSLSAMDVCQAKNQILFHSEFTAIQNLQYFTEILASMLNCTICLIFELSGIYIFGIWRNILGLGLHSVSCPLVSLTLFWKSRPLPWKQFKSYIFI